MYPDGHDPAERKKLMMEEQKEYLQEWRKEVEYVRKNGLPGVEKGQID